MTDEISLPDPWEVTGILPLQIERHGDGNLWARCMVVGCGDSWLIIYGLDPVCTFMMTSAVDHANKHVEQAAKSAAEEPEPDPEAAALARAYGRLGL